MRNAETRRHSGVIGGMLLLVAAVAHIAPEALPGSVRAWEYVCTGVEATALWLAVAALLPGRGLPRLGGLAVCAYGVFESIQRPVCRLAFPMDAPPPQGGFLCDMAGVPTSALSMLAVCMVAAVVSHASTYKDC